MGADDWHDPHDLIPETFKREYRSFESVRDALEHQERLPSSTPEAARARCPDCGSTSITPHNTAPDGGPAPADWKCTECKTWFDDPEKPTMNDYDTKKSTRFRWNREEDILLPENRSALGAAPDDFEWVAQDDLKDPDERGMNALFAGLDRETLLAVTIVLREPWRDSGPSYPEIAELLPYADSWVGHRVREWRDGEHRDLVPDPTAEPEPAPSNDPPIDPRAAVGRIGGDYEELVDERTASSDASSGPAAVATDGGRRRRWGAFGSG